MTSCNIFPRLLLGILFLSLLWLGACKKDNTTITKSFRVIEVSDYNQGILFEHDTIIYSGDKVLLYNEYSFPSGKEISTIQFDYLDESSIIATKYAYDSTGLRYPVSKVTYGLEGDHVTQYIGYDCDTGIWNPLFRYDYLYENDLIIQETDYRWEQGKWQPDLKIEYEYEEGLVIRSFKYRYYNDWSLSNKEEVIYHDGRISESYIYDYLEDTFMISSSNYCYYFGDHLEGIDNFIMGISDWELYMKYYFQYDANGNLESTMYDYFYEEYSYTSTYTYIDGKGNYRQLFHLPGIFDIIFPLPTKSKPGNNPGKYVLSTRAANGKEKY